MVLLVLHPGGSKVSLIVWLLLKLKNAQFQLDNCHHLVGNVMSICLVTGNLPRITTRHCQMTVAIAENWDTPMILDEYCEDEIVFWKNIHLRNFKTALFSTNLRM